jgi:AcrR family transcriptional regulator
MNKTYQRQFEDEHFSALPKAGLFGQQTSIFTKMKPEMTVKTANKHELKTRETRELLLRAAETIFVRDGYEGAELGEIAALAGRTKGAIYAQFESKEDIFLALVEDHRLRYRALAEQLLAESTTVEGNIAALRSFYLKLAEDETWALLLLEVKLFAIRHPKSKKRLQSVFAEAISPKDEKRIADILGPAGKGKNAISRVVAIQTMQPMLSALVLETKFDSAMLGEDVIRKVVGRIFDALLEIPPR